MSYTIAGIDVHKKMLAVVTADVESEVWELERARFGTTVDELERLRGWLAERGVREVVMESTAQYWRTVWLELEADFALHLAQAHSNRARRGRKDDYRDAERLLRRHACSELILSFVPERGQREQRMLTRAKVHLLRERVRLGNQLECLLEQARIKLATVVSDLLGLSARRMLRASADELRAALRGSLSPTARQLLRMQLDHIELIDAQVAELDARMAELVERDEEAREAVLRLAETPGLGADSAQQIVAEVGARAATFDSAAELCSWVGVCPGRNESAERNHSSRCAKGNPYLRRILIRRRMRRAARRGATSKACCDGCCRSWAIRRRSGRSRTASAG